jgi:hypothetical protein
MADYDVYQSLETQQEFFEGTTSRSQTPPRLRTRASMTSLY